MYFQIGYTSAGHAAIVVCTADHAPIGYIYAAGEELIIDAAPGLVWTEEGRDHKQLRLDSLPNRRAVAAAR